MEKECFSAGRYLFTFKINGFSLSPIICHDIRFPELSRASVLKHGVDVILHCGAHARDSSFPTWHAFATTRAIENDCSVLSLNRAGQNYGNSLFCYPWMDETFGSQLFAEHEEGFRRIKIARRRLHDALTTYTILKDRWDSYDLSCQGQR